MGNPSKKSILVISVFMFAVLLLLFKSNMTGLTVPGGIAKDVNAVFDSYSEYSASFGAPIHSLSASGKVTGDGIVRMWLSNGDNRLLIWSNAADDGRHCGVGNLGVVDSRDVDAYSPVCTTSFSYKCMETCTLPDGFGDGNYVIQAEVDNGTTLAIYSLIYY